MNPSSEFLNGGMMDRKKIILIVAVVIVVIAIIAGYFITTTPTVNQNQTTLVLSKSAYMNVPIAQNASSKADNDGIFHYIDAENGINVTSCNSNISKNTSISKMNKLKNSIESSAKKVITDGVVLYEKNGTYSIFVKNLQYNNTIMLQSLNKNLLILCWKTLKFHDPTDNFKFDNTTSTVVDAVEQTQSVVGEITPSYTSSSSSSYQEPTSSEGSSWNYQGYASGGGGSSDDYGDYVF